MVRPASVIYFDAVGTLIHPEPRASVVYAEVGKRFGSRVTDVAFRFAKAFTAEESLDRAAGWRTGEERESERWRNIVVAVLDDVTRPEECFAELYEHFSKPSAWRIEHGADEVLRELRRRGHRLGIGSNYDHRLHSVLAGLPLEVDHLLISSEAGWRKPARQFFEAMIGQANTPEIVFVGDDLENDYLGATSAGLQAVLFDPKGSHDNFNGVRIRSLAELLR